MTERGMPRIPKDYSEEVKVTKASCSRGLEHTDFTRLRLRERLYSKVLIGTIGFLLMAGITGYVARETLARDNYYDSSPYSKGEIYTTYGDGAVGAGKESLSGAGAAGGCCGSSAVTESGTNASAGNVSASGGGCCGSGGGKIVAAVDLSELERQGLEKFKSEGGKTEKFTAKAGDYGCHLQVDIVDEKNQIVASYGYQGDTLYVIR